MADPTIPNFEVEEALPATGTADGLGQRGDLTRGSPEVRPGLRRPAVSDEATSTRPSWSQHDVFIGGAEVRSPSARSESW